MAIARLSRVLHGKHIQARVEACTGGSGTDTIIVASEPGTYFYKTGTRSILPEQMGLMGARIVRAAFPLGDNCAYDITGDGQATTIILSNIVILPYIVEVIRPDLDDPRTIHWHGASNQIAIFDGLPDIPVVSLPGGSLTYFYRPLEESTDVYHCHFEGTEHLQMGMDGVVLVGPATCSRTADPATILGCLDKENGGIAGIVYYATTRAEDDPRLAAAEDYEPGIPTIILCGGPAGTPDFRSVGVVHVSAGSSIQAAIDAAEPGSRIFLEPGVYVENLIIYKKITLQGLGPGATLIHGLFRLVDPVGVNGFVFFDPVAVNGFVILPPGVTPIDGEEGEGVGFGAVDVEIGGNFSGLLGGRGYPDTPDQLQNLSDTGEPPLGLGRDSLLLVGSTTFTHGRSVIVDFGEKAYEIDHNVICVNTAAEDGGGILGIGAGGRDIEAEPEEPEELGPAEPLGPLGPRPGALPVLGPPGGEDAGPEEPAEPEEPE